MPETIKSSREIDNLFERGVRASNAYVMILAVPTPTGRDQSGRVVYIAGKKLGGAVMRNRAKRVLRESARRTGGSWGGFDVALIARPKTATVKGPALDAAVVSALRNAGIGAI